jgi:hypothetical protein
LACLPILLGQGDLAAQVETDVNIATGLDISSSVGRHEGWLERVGAARGLGLPRLRRGRPVGPPWPGWRRRCRLEQPAGMPACGRLEGRRHPRRRGSGRRHAGGEMPRIRNSISRSRSASPRPVHRYDRVDQGLLSQPPDSADRSRRPIMHRISEARCPKSFWLSASGASAGDADNRRTLS